MNFKKFKLYKIFREEGGEYASILMKSKLMMPVLPVLEDIHGLNRSEYKRSRLTKNDSRQFRCIVIYEKRGMR